MPPPSPNGERQPQVEKVWFPWLASHPHHQLARADGASRRDDFRGGERAMISAPGKVISRLKTVYALQRVSAAWRAGQPFSMTHASIPLEQRLANGITPQLIRLSVGD